MVHWYQWYDWYQQKMISFQWFYWWIFISLRALRLSWAKDTRLIFWKKPIVTRRHLLFSTTTGAILKSSVHWFFLLSHGPHRKLQPRKEPAKYNVSTTLTVKDINSFTMTLITGNYCTSESYHDKPHDSSEKWLQSLEYNTALLGATKYNTKL